MRERLQIGRMVCLVATLFHETGDRAIHEEAFFGKRRQTIQATWEACMNEPATHYLPQEEARHAVSSPASKLVQQ